MLYTTSNGNNCPWNDVVLTEAECEDAANQLAMSYRGEKTGVKYPAGCYHHNKEKVYFNNIYPTLSVPEIYYGAPGAICSTSTGMVNLDIFFALNIYFVRKFMNKINI